MSEENKPTTPFLGTYFDPDLIFRLSNVSKVLGWVILVVYGLDFLVSLTVMILQIARGFWVSMGFTDYVSYILMTLERPFRGMVYFVLLLGISEVLKVFVEIEGNTRRAARKQVK